MKEFEEFSGKDFEQMMLRNGFITEAGAVDRVAAAEFLGVCKRTIGYMLDGRITKQMYNLLAVHAGHHGQRLLNTLKVTRELTDDEFEDLMTNSKVA